MGREVGVDLGRLDQNIPYQIVIELIEILSNGEKEKEYLRENIE